MHTVSYLQFYDPTGNFFDHTITGDLQFLFGIQQILPDRQTLGTMLLTFAAANAVGSTGTALTEGGTHEILPQAGKLTL